MRPKQLLCGLVLGITWPALLRYLVFVACLMPACLAEAIVYKAPSGTLKDNCVVWHEGTYYLFTMYRREQVPADADPMQWRHVWLATSADGRTAWCGYAVGGLLRSDDGVRWRWSGDFAFIDDLRPRVVQEPGGCQRIGDLYYLLVGGFYPGSFNYAVATFTAQHPAGPFAPDYPAFRLNGASGRKMVGLWAGYRPPPARPGKGGQCPLVNHISSGRPGDNRFSRGNAVVLPSGGQDGKSARPHPGHGDSRPCAQRVFS